VRNGISDKVGPAEFKPPLSLISPETGLSSPTIPLTGGRDVNIELPSFRHDLVARVTKGVAQKS
jgi:hypothetical protein